MTFREYLLSQKDRPDAIGDLAYEYARDPNAPSSATALREYLGWDGCTEAEVLDQAIAEWKAQRRAETNVSPPRR